MGEGHCRTKLQLRSGQNSTTWICNQANPLVIQCSKHSQLTLNSQKGLHFLQVSTPREPFYKDEGMYEGELRDLLLGCARDACVTYEIDEAMDADLDELGVRKFYENFLMKLPDFYPEIENNGFRSQ